MKKIRILLADDHNLIRRGLRLVIEQQPDLAVVGEASDGREAVSLAASLKPEVAVLDIGMPNLNGIEAAKQITEGESGAAVVILSMYSERKDVLHSEGAEIGSSWLPLERFGRNPIWCARYIQWPMANLFQPNGQPRAAGGLHAEAATNRRRKFGHDLLTPRERRVLQLIAEGESQTKKSPSMLNLSVYTVETHRGNPDGKAKVKRGSGANSVCGSKRDYLLKSPNPHSFPTCCRPSALNHISFSEIAVTQSRGNKIPTGWETRK